MQSRDIFIWVLSSFLISLGVLAQAQDGDTDVTTKIQQLESGLAQVMQDLKGEENYLLSVLTGQQTLLANKIDKLISQNDVLRTELTKATNKLLCETGLLIRIGTLNTTYLNGTTYYFSYNQPKLSWYEADNFCRSHGMHLVSVETRAEWEMLKPEVKKLRDKFGASPWSSGSDAAEEGKWKWTATGSDVIFFARRDMENVTSQNCMLFHTDYWDDYSCTYKTSFICKVKSAC